MTPYTEQELRTLPNVMRAEHVLRVLDISEEGLRSLREALRGEPGDIVAFGLGKHFRYAKIAVFKQAKLEHLLSGPEPAVASAKPKPR